MGRWLEHLHPFYRALGRYYGDSGIFIRRDVYERVGGFPEIPVMKDVMFVRRMERAGETAYLPGAIASSPRRWEERPLRTLMLWGFMRTAFALGANPRRLASLYKAHDAEKKAASWPRPLPTKPAATHAARRLSSRTLLALLVGVAPLLLGRPAVLLE
ncbi:MAG: hypothetical protein M3N18_03895 [Actinomycetota bacterium]|nr:hypothetical protein [Actinomycetota bacterium]